MWYGQSLRVIDVWSADRRFFILIGKLYVGLIAFTYNAFAPTYHTIIFPVLIESLSCYSLMPVSFSWRFLLVLAAFSLVRIRRPFCITFVSARGFQFIIEINFVHFILIHCVFTRFVFINFVRLDFNRLATFLLSAFALTALILSLLIWNLFIFVSFRWEKQQRERSQDCWCLVWET